MFKSIPTICTLGVIGLTIFGREFDLWSAVIITQGITILIQDFRINLWKERN
jgi:hypothetical protein